ncbi:MAG: ABC transporter permease [Anaerolineae bacterium]|nr:ABC transporter permease [Anaerolineae bacterium]
MSPRRIGVLLAKELVWGPKGFVFIMAVAAPVIVSLLVNLLVGSFFSGKPSLAVFDGGTSQMVAALRANEGLLLREAGSAGAVESAVRSGAADMGLILPAGFDEELRGGAGTAVTVYVYGESLLKDRAFLATAIASQLRAITGDASPVEIVTETLGDGASIPWEERLLPLVVMMAVIFGGIMVPATSLVQEKQDRTITAVTTTTVSLAELFVAKGILGFLLALVMGVVILLINQAFGARPLLLIGLLALGAVMATTFGVIMGALVKDINTLFATIKGLGILLYAPAFIYLFPSLPGWIARIFPTYYMIAPIVEVTQRGASWADVRLDVAILIVLDLALIAVLAALTYRARRRPAMLPGLVS